MKEKLPQRRAPHGQETERHPSSQSVMRSREVTREMLKGTNSVEDAFLEKYQSDTVFEAVQKEDYAAMDFMEYVSRHKKFGTMDKQELRVAIVKSVECSLGAALSFMMNAPELEAFLGEECMRGALYDAILRYSDCHQYFVNNYMEKFAHMHLARELHLQLSQMDRDHLRFSN